MENLNETLNVKMDKLTINSSGTKNFFPVQPQKGKMAQRLKDAAPYNFFLTTVTAAEETHSEPLSITFQDLLDDSLGELKASVQFSFEVDVDWLKSQYERSGHSDKPLLIIHGDEENPELEALNWDRNSRNISSHYMKKSTQGYGIHHAKIMLFEYTDKSIRVVISSANACEADWRNLVQGIWVSDKLAKLPKSSNSSDYNSSTYFREEFLDYLATYDLNALKPWMQKIREANFSSVNVFFVGSTPRIKHATGSFGFQKMAKILTRYSAPIDPSCPIVAQSSSIGKLGTSSEMSHLFTEILPSFQKCRPADNDNGTETQSPFKFIFPTKSNVEESVDFYASMYLPYHKDQHTKQSWLENHMHHWKSESRNRTRVVPHIKTYCRFGDEGLYWFCLTSANLSRSGWGYTISGKKQGQSTFTMNNFEAGVLFMPRVMIGRDCFPLNESQQQNGEIPIFPMPYDVDLMPYTPEDSPFFVDYLMERIASENAEIQGEK